MAGPSPAERRISPSPEESNPSGLSRRDFLRVSGVAVLGLALRLNDSAGPNDLLLTKEALVDLNIIPGSGFKVKENGESDTVYVASKSGEQYDQYLIKGVANSSSDDLIAILTGRIIKKRTVEGTIIGGGAAFFADSLKRLASPNLHHSPLGEIARMGVATTVGVVSGATIGSGFLYLSQPTDEERYRLLNNLPKPLSSILVPLLDPLKRGWRKPRVPITVEQNPTPTPTTIIKPTGTSTPTIEITPTANPYIFTSSEWANGKEGEFQGKLDPRKMFTIVGAIDHRNRRFLGLDFAGVNVAYDSGKDLTQVSDQQAEKDEASKSLDLNNDVKAQLVKVHGNVEVLIASEYSGSAGKIKSYVVVEKVDGQDQVSQIILEFQSGTLYRYSVDSEGQITRLSKEEEPPLLPELYVDGPYIKRRDTEEIVVFKGVSIFLNDVGRNKTGKSISQYVIWNVLENEKLGIKSNIVRLSFNSKDVDNEKDLDDFVTTVDLLAQKGIYVVLTPHNDDTQRSTPNDNSHLPNEKDKQIIVKLAEKLRDKQNVIYGLWNEPAGTNWYTWSRILQDIYNRMLPMFEQRANKPIFMVPGIEWSRDFRSAIIPLPNGSYIIDVHNYAYYNNDVTYMWEGMVGRVPMLITEMGNPAEGGPQSTADLKVIQDTFDTIHKYPPGQIGYMNWRGEDGHEGLRENGVLTARGRLNLEERSNFPTQTDFTN